MDTELLHRNQVAQSYDEKLKVGDRVFVRATSTGQSVVGTVTKIPKPGLLVYILFDTLQAHPVQSNRGIYEGEQAWITSRVFKINSLTRGVR